MIINNIINDNNNKKEQKKEINDLCDYRENVCKSISNSDKIDKNDENDEFIYQNSSQDIDNLLNLDMSSENNIKPESMKINCLPSSLK
jgi:hypothetical protein